MRGALFPCTTLQQCMTLFYRETTIADGDLRGVHAPTESGALTPRDATALQPLVPSDCSSNSCPGRTRAGAIREFTVKLVGRGVRAGHAGTRFDIFCCQLFSLAARGRYKLGRYERCLVLLLPGRRCKFCPRFMSPGVKSVSYSLYICCIVLKKLYKRVQHTFCPVEHKLRSGNSLFRFASCVSSSFGVR